jgi:hypothetical protein
MVSFRVAEDRRGPPIDTRPRRWLHRLLERFYQKQTSAAMQARPGSIGRSVPRLDLDDRSPVVAADP